MADSVFQRVTNFFGEKAKDGDQDARSCTVPSQCSMFVPLL